MTDLGEVYMPFVTSQRAWLPEPGVSGHSFLNVEFIDGHIIVRKHVQSESGIMSDL